MDAGSTFRSATGPRKGHVSLWMTVGGAVLFLLYLVLVVLRELAHPVNTDNATFLYITQHMLRGELALYKDFLETNPPFFVLHNLLPVLAAELTGADAFLLFKLWVFALILGSALWGAHLSGRGGLSSYEGLALAAAFVVAATYLPQDDFGQREHMALILGWPYVLMQAGRQLGGRYTRSEIGLTGVMAALGFLIKPFFLFVPVFLTLLAWWQTRRMSVFWRPEFLIIVAGGVLYVLVVRLFFPEYLTDVVPLLLQSYTALEQPMLLRLAFIILAVPYATPLIFGFLLLPAVLAAIHHEKDPRIRTYLAYLFLALSGFLLSGFVQGKPWRYTYISYFMILFAIALWLILLWGFRLRKRTGWRERPSLSLMRLLAVFSAAVLLQGWPGSYPTDKKIEMTRDVVRFVQPGERVMALVTDNGILFPMVNVHGLKSVWRFVNLWPAMPAILERLEKETSEAGLSARARKLERRLLSSITEDLDKGNPELVLIEKGAVRYYYFPKGAVFDVDAYLANFPAFRERLEQRYAPVHETRYLRFYLRRDLLRRARLPSAGGNSLTASQQAGSLQ